MEIFAKMKEGCPKDEYEPIQDIYHKQANQVREGSNSRDSMDIRPSFESNASSKFNSIDIKNENKFHIIGEQTLVGQAKNGNEKYKSAMFQSAQKDTAISQDVPTVIQNNSKVTLSKSKTLDSLSGSPNRR
jgi:hypothetical protein